VQSDEENHVVICGDTDLNEVATALEAALGESESTKLIWQPTISTELDLEGLTNFEASDEVMEAFGNAQA